MPTNLDQLEEYNFYPHCSFTHNKLVIFHCMMFVYVINSTQTHRQTPECCSHPSHLLLLYKMLTFQNIDIVNQMLAIHGFKVMTTLEHSSWLRTLEVTEVLKILSNPFCCSVTTVNSQQPESHHFIPQIYIFKLILCMIPSQKNKIQYLLLLLLLPYLLISSFMCRFISSLGTWKERVVSAICSRIRIHLLSEVGNLYNLQTGFLNTAKRKNNTILWLCDSDNL